MSRRERHDPTAARAWALMQDLVEGQDRRAELARTLGFRLGGGRSTVLLRLRDGPATLVELAAAIGSDAPYATVVVDQLETHGLVARGPHPDDRRRKLVSLTPAGEQAVATVDAVWRRPPAELQRLDGAHLQQLVTLLTELTPDEPPRDTRPPGQEAR
ncbi:MarR family winged helix-turn-helix transcriptional regulator [Rhodococcus aerolatus]